MSIDQRVPDATTPDGRTPWVDTAKGLAILLMFYGHFLQVGIAPTNASATEQLRFIYSFHMPFFFCAAGFFFRPTRRPWSRVWVLSMRRLVPVAFFSLLFAPLWLVGERHHRVRFWHDTAALIKDYANGRPVLDWVTWFLVCLFVCELLALPLLSRLKTRWLGILFGLACIIGGVSFCNHSLDAERGVLYFIGQLWFLSEAVVALGLYAIGYVCYPLLARAFLDRRIALVAFLLGLTIAVATFGLNSVADQQSLVMMSSRHQGYPLCFILTALAGTLAVAAAGRVFDRVRWLVWMGRSSLPLMGLNGLFFKYYPLLARRWPIRDSSLVVSVDGLLVTAGSLLVCLPAVLFLKRFLPQLIGASNLDGPWLPSLEKPLRWRAAPPRATPYA